MAASSNLEYAQEVDLQPILRVAERAGINPDHLELYGRFKAKFREEAFDSSKPLSPLVLVSAMTPTKAGEGKTTTTIGLTQALNKLGKRAVAALREPSLGPVFGTKGGGCGGGRSQILPMEDINLHFTGDIHAISSAHNLLAALIDNQIHFKKSPAFDVRRINWRRAMDMNDRFLRQVVIGLGGVNGGVPREDGFIITAASEIMAILALAADVHDLKQRLGRIVAGFSTSGEPIHASQLKADGPMAVLLREAIQPNLVQTTEGCPAIVHAGPFANIAHGCNSVRATRLARQYGEIAVTEAGFAFDLGGEKFLDIKARMSGHTPAMVVLVVTIPSTKMHGGLTDPEDSKKPNPAALERGFANIRHHIQTIRSFGLPALVSINRRPTDTDEEVRALQELTRQAGAAAIACNVYGQGGDGGLDLAREVLSVLENQKSPPAIQHPYQPGDSLENKVNAIARKVYGCAGARFSPEAEKQAEKLAALGLDQAPVCMAKTQYSITDNPALLADGDPGHHVEIREIRYSRGAGFAVAIAGDMMIMPGLSKTPAAGQIDLVDGKIVGLF
ncbi:MAG: Formate--tetrahydrofolate ligase [Myxococcota bacterium]|nr:Formate--tetrahydrofolate ligase [Myxococcota bacterium]